MDLPLYTEVILVQNMPDEGLQAADVGVVVERHEVIGRETGYSVEFFDMLGNTVAVAAVSGSVLCTPTQAALDDESLQDLKEQLIDAEELAIDKDDKMLVWTGHGETLPSSQPPNTWPKAFVRNSKLWNPVGQVTASGKRSRLS